MSHPHHPPLIELRDVSRRYVMGHPDDENAVVVPALQGVSLAIEAGEYVAVIGQSGSGKSTLMNILGCLDRPSEGAFLIDGQDASDFEPDELAALRRERFGFIFQRYHLLPGMDARANAALPAVYAGRSRDERIDRAEELLARLGLEERMHHRPNELSGGQQQRVSIARALMNGGQIILADEPTGALDSNSGAEMLRQLDALHANGHTVIVVTHDHKVAAHAKRVIELADGQVLRDTGTPAGHVRPASVDSMTQRDASWWGHWRSQPVATIGYSPFYTLPRTLTQLRWTWRQAIAAAALLADSKTAVLVLVLGIVPGALMALCAQAVKSMLAL